MRLDSIQALALLATGVALAVPASGHAAPLQVQWGQSGDVPVPRDFDGDGLADYVVFRPADGYWHVKSSATGSVRSEQWGQAGDIPVPGDYDGDGRIDFVVWRPSNGIWFVKNHDGVYIRWEQWGQAGDIPVPGDYDGDGRIEFAVFRPGNGVWYSRSYTTGVVRTATWGQAGDVPVPGGYDNFVGDDYAIWRPSTGQWWTMGGTTFVPTQPFTWGISSDLPIAARLCGDMPGRSVYRLGGWLSVGQPTTYLGVGGDVPVPADFGGDQTPDRAVWRPSTGMWILEHSACDRFAPTNARLASATPDLRGVTVAAIKNGSIVYANGVGMANATQPATAFVPFQIASISKLFIATAVLQAGIALDVPAGLANPYNFAMPTVRQLANHTAGVRKDVCTVSSWFGAEPWVNLGQGVDPCFFAGNTFAAWQNRMPGTEGEYSNLGAAWPARLVESASGQDFTTFTRQRIFTPLTMTSTGWFAHELGGQAFSVGYHANGAQTNESGVSPYAIGNLRSSAFDLAKFMIVWTDDGQAFGRQILAPGQVATALQLANPTKSGFGLYWAQSWTAGRYTWGHGGVLGGVCTRLNIDPVRREGVVILTNGPCSVANAHITAIEDRTFRILDSI